MCISIVSLIFGEYLNRTQSVTKSSAGTGGRSMQKKHFMLKFAGLLSQTVDEITIFYMRATLQLVAIQAIIMHLVCIPSIFSDIMSPQKALIATITRIIDALYCTFSVMYLVHVEAHVYCPTCRDKTNYEAFTLSCLCVRTKLGALTKSFTIGFFLRSLLATIFSMFISPMAIISYLIELCTLLYYLVISIIIPVPFLIKVIYMAVGLTPLAMLSYKLSGHLIVVPFTLVIALCVGDISYHVVNFSRKNGFFSIVPIQNMLTILSTQIMNLFLNALPSRLVPSIMDGLRVEPTVCMNVCFSYIAITDDAASIDKTVLRDVDSPEGIGKEKIDAKTRGFMSRLNLYYCLLDFLSECIGVQKVKSTYTLYMVAAGLEEVLDINCKSANDWADQGLASNENGDTQLSGNSYGERISKVDSPRGSSRLPSKVNENRRRFKQIATFCLAAKIAGESLGFSVSAGITRGPIITGMLGQGQANCNFDVWGDVVNMAARIARGFTSGVFIKLDDFYNPAMDSFSVPSWLAGTGKDISSANYSTCYIDREEYFQSEEVNQRLEQKRRDVSKYLPNESIVATSKQIIDELPPCYMFGMSFPRIYKGKAGITQITELIETDYLPWLLRRTFSISYRKLLLSYISEDAQHVVGLYGSPLHQNVSAKTDPKKAYMNSEIGPEQKQKELKVHELLERFEQSLFLEQNDSPHIENALMVVKQRDKLDEILDELELYRFMDFSAVHGNDTIPLKENHAASLSSLSNLATNQSQRFSDRSSDLRRIYMDEAAFNTAFVHDSLLQRLIYCIYSGDYSLLSHGGEMIDLRICFGLPAFITGVKLHSSYLPHPMHPARITSSGNARRSRSNMNSPRNITPPFSSSCTNIHSDSSDNAQDCFTNSQLMLKSIYKQIDTGAKAQFYKSHISALVADPHSRKSEVKHRNLSMLNQSSMQDLHASMRLTQDGSSGRRFKRKKNVSDLHLQVKEPEANTNAVEEYFSIKQDVKPLQLSQAAGSFASSFRLPEPLATPRTGKSPRRHDFLDIPKVLMEKNSRKLSAAPKSRLALLNNLSKSFIKIDEEPRTSIVSSQTTENIKRIMSLDDSSNMGSQTALSREVSMDEYEFPLGRSTKQTILKNSAELPLKHDCSRFKLSVTTTNNDEASHSLDENAHNIITPYFKDSTLNYIEHYSTLTTVDDTMFSPTMSLIDPLQLLKGEVSSPKASIDDMNATWRKLNRKSATTRALSEEGNMQFGEDHVDSDSITVSNDELYSTSNPDQVLATPTVCPPGNQTTPIVPDNLKHMMDKDILSMVDIKKPILRRTPAVYSTMSSKTSLVLGSGTVSTVSLEKVRAQSTEGSQSTTTKDTYHRSLSTRDSAYQRSNSSTKREVSTGSIYNMRMLGKSTLQVQSKALTLMRTPLKQATAYQPVMVTADQRVQNFFTFFNSGTVSTPTVKPTTPKNLLTLAPVQTEDIASSQVTNRHSRSGSYMSLMKLVPHTRDDPSTASQSSHKTLHKSYSALDMWTSPIKSSAVSKTSDLSDHDHSFEPSNLSVRSTTAVTPSRKRRKSQEDEQMFNSLGYDLEEDDAGEITFCSDCIGLQGSELANMDDKKQVPLFNYQILLRFLIYICMRIKLLFTLSFSVRKRCINEIDFAFMVTGMMSQGHYYFDFLTILLMYLAFLACSIFSEFSKNSVIFIFGTTIYFSYISIIYFIMLSINLLWVISMYIYLRYYKTVRRAVKVDLDKATECGESSDNLGRDLIFSNFITAFRVITTFVTTLSIYIIQCCYSIGFNSTLSSVINEQPNIVALLIFLMIPFQFFYILILLSPTLNSVFFISFNFFAIISAVLLLVTLSFSGQIETAIINLIVLVTLFVYSSTKIEAYSEILNWKATVTKTIKIYKDRLNPILPGMTIDVMIAANQPEAIASTEGVFQFIESYMCDLNYMIPIEELESLLQIQRIDPCKITDTSDNAATCINFTEFKLDRRVILNPSPFVSIKGLVGGSPAILETGKEDRHDYKQFIHTVQDTIEYRRKQLYKGFIYSMHQYLHFSDPRYLPFNRPIIYFGHVGYLSLDIINFTKLSSEHDAKSILRFLGELFSEFDKRIDRAPQLKQIKSIGDAYEVMGVPGTLKKYGNSGKHRGQHTPQQKVEDQFLQLYDGLLLLVMAGFGFIEDCSDVCKKHFSDKVNYLGLRVGVCTGIAFGSLLGSKQFRFDVFGSVPEEADAVQSEASTNAIFVSKRVKDILERGEYNWRMRFMEYQTEQEALGLQPMRIQNEHLSLEFVEVIKNSVVMYEVKSVVDVRKEDYFGMFSAIGEYNTF